MLCFDSPQSEYVSLGAEKSFMQWMKEDLTTPLAEPTSWASTMEGEIEGERGESKEAAMAVSLSIVPDRCSPLTIGDAALHRRG